MVNRTDPGSVGVVAGRLVGALTVVLTAAVMVTHGEEFYRMVRLLLAGLESDFVPVRIVFWINVAFVAAGRYAFCYVLGSLIGVGYDWLDRPGIAFLAVGVVLIGTVDGIYGGMGAGNVLVGAGYLLAWLAYVPVFAWLLEGDKPTADGPVRLE
ncbi:hypothetical protein HLRTI_002550 [Halorhabdus tiamatea SARL4B]|uniref:Hypothetical membrane protein n=1 Tax=Halorhabdus tiamatea SARL4B TaxID=1033806 RepID=F7PLG8_9EURY|nr:hypothetical protein [Halorhabdus tiamatea]ERJ05478.1 hypothetical protein HLRTI_002550 [Halorhabdus tiamatea SARL4B]CCQ33592.1 hypothetical membrane protein [Halorhabdus tiamatea SARL4B]